MPIKIAVVGLPPRGSDRHDKAKNPVNSYQETYQTLLMRRIGAEVAVHELLGLLSKCLTILLILSILT
jgi:hypothetical protein